MGTRTLTMLASSRLAVVAARRSFSTGAETTIQLNAGAFNSFECNGPTMTETTVSNDDMIKWYKDMFTIRRMEIAFKPSPGYKPEPPPEYKPVPPPLYKPQSVSTTTTPALAYKPELTTTTERPKLVYKSKWITKPEPKYKPEPTPAYKPEPEPKYTPTPSPVYYKPYHP